MRTRNHLWFSLALLCVGSTGLCQTKAPHPAAWLAASGVPHFYRMTADGTRLLVCRAEDRKTEELVEVPVDGSQETLWLRHQPRKIQNGFTWSGDGSTVAFVAQKGGQAYVLRRPGAAPTVVASVQTDAPLRNVSLTDDGRWVPSRPQRW